MTQDYARLNAENVLKIVNGYIRILENRNANRERWEPRPTLRIREVCDRLSIFDWWNDKLSISQLKDMKKFLETSIELGYTGYVCFKVGATGCSHGMWSYRTETTDGYSPDGAFLFKSFTPSKNYWNMMDDAGEFITDKIGTDHCALTTKKALKNALNAV